MVTGYALTFGGFLLLGGKLADRVARRQVFIVGGFLLAAALMAFSLVRVSKEAARAALKEGAAAGG